MEARKQTNMADIMKLDGSRTLDFDREMVEQAYDRWAPIYDLVFGGVFSKGRRAAILATNKIGGRVLEVGVARVFHCRNMRLICASSARIFRKPCCKRRRNASPS